MSNTTPYSSKSQLSSPLNPPPSHNPWGTTASLPSSPGRHDSSPRQSLVASLKSPSVPASSTSSLPIPPNHLSATATPPSYDPWHNSFKLNLNSTLHPHPHTISSDEPWSSPNSPDDTEDPMDLQSHASSSAIPPSSNDFTAPVIPDTSPLIGLSDDFSWLSNMPQTIITIAPERGGSFFNRYVNYYVRTAGSDLIVTRRYSDFLCLNEYLSKRFPFRLLLSLPPKKVNGVNADAEFLERRRRALQRYTTHILRHPELCMDGFVHVFFNQREEIASYRKTHSLDATPEEPPLNKDIGPSLSNSTTINGYLKNLTNELEPTFQRYQRIVNGLENVATKNAEISHELTDIAAAMLEMGNRRPHCFSSTCTSCSQIVDRSGFVALRVESLGHAYQHHSDSLTYGSIEVIKSLRDQAAALELLLQRSVKAISTHRSNMLTLERRLDLARSRTNLANSANDAISLKKINQTRVADEASLQVQVNAVQWVTHCLGEELKVWHRQSTVFALALHQWVQENATMATCIHKITSTMNELILVPDKALPFVAELTTTPPASGSSSILADPARAELLNRSLTS